MKFQERLQRIKGKLEKLKSLDQDMSIFGSGDDKFFGTPGHHYELNPVLTEQEVLEIEKKLNISIPEEYREFLLNVGDGGAGPAWGLISIKWAFPDDEFLKKYPDFCSQEFSYDESWAEGIRAHFKDDPAYMEPLPDPFGGYFKLNDYGHAMSAILIVGHGSQYGKMWFLDDDAPSFAPMHQEVQGREWYMSFLDWYENWLDESLTPGVMIDNPKNKLSEPEEVKALNYRLHQLESIPKQSFECMNLERLDLQFNKIASLSEDEIENLKKMKKLKVLVIAGNPMTKEEFARIAQLLPDVDVVF